MEKKLTLKDKKEEMLKAYEELLDKYKEKEKADKGTGKEAEMKRTVEEAVVEKVSTYTVESIIKGLADLKLDLSKTLTDISDKLIAEAAKLEEVQQAIAIETRNLEGIYDIKVAAETLATLIIEHEEKKKAFEEEIVIIKEQCKKDEEEHERMIKERDENLKKERKREDEDYTYNLALSRKKDSNAYEEEKAALKKALKEERAIQEKELAEREAIVAAEESEIAELKAKVESFPDSLTKAIDETKKEVTIQTENQAKQKAELLAKETLGEKKVAELKIKNLEDTIANQAAQIEALTKQLNNMTTQVQDIAIKAIEGASGVRALSAVNEIALEQAKNVSIRK
jgi:uncharacterized coiled-coil protein SlyX